MAFSQCGARKMAIEYSQDESRVILQNDFIQLKFYHLSDDSTALFFKIKNTELLTARDIESKELTAKISGQMLLFNIDTNKIIDTIQFKASGNTSKEKLYFYFYSVNFPLADSKIYNYRLVLKDKNRGTQYSINGTINKTSELSEENIILLQEENSFPNFNLLINENSNYRLKSERLDLTQTKLWFRSESESLPPPPYSSSREGLPEMSGFGIFDTPIEKNELVLENLPLGDLLITKDSVGLSILNRPLKFPELTSISEMISPLRYISARKEFERLNSNSNLRVGLEKFWLDCGENQERATELMSTFYARVQTANLNFSSFKSGWKTDRGLILIVFGSPTEFTFTPTSETWVYGDKTDLGSIEFTFDKIINGFSDNHFELKRNSIYKSEWAKKVSAWRNGRIYN